MPLSYTPYSAINNNNTNKNNSQYIDDKIAPIIIDKTLTNTETDIIILPKGAISNEAIRFEKGKAEVKIAQEGNVPEKVSGSDQGAETTAKLQDVLRYFRKGPI